MGLPRATAFRFGQGHFEAVFNFYLIAGETKNGRAQIHALERVAILFLGCDMTLGTTKGRKDDTNIHVLNWGGPLLGVQNSTYLSNPKNGHQTNRTVQ